MTTRARAIHLKHQQQPLLCKSRIQAPIGALGIRLFIRLFKIRLNSPTPYTISPISPPSHHHLPATITTISHQSQLILLNSKFQSVSREMNCDCYFLIRMIHLSGYWYVPEFKRLLEIDQLIQESWDTDEMLKDKKYFDLTKLSLLEFWDTRRNSKIKDILNLPSICHYWNPPVLNPLTCSP